MKHQPWIVLVALLLCGYGNDSQAVTSRHKPTPAKKAATHRATANPGSLPCQVAIDPKEDREIVIMKLLQRMDCLEGKVNYLSEQLSMQTHGSVKPFVEKPKEFVIRYPREPETP